MKRFSDITPPIFIYGPPGSGKSAAGRLLAETLNLNFVDLDDQISSKSGISIPEIFAAEGEQGFRQREQEALAGTLLGSSVVVALGGGALLNPSNRQEVEAAGPIFCLNAGADTLFARIQASGEVRPLVGIDSRAGLERLLSDRADHYGSFSEKLNTGDQSPEEVVWQIQIRLGRFHIRGMGEGYDVRVKAGIINLVGDHLRASGLEGPVCLVSDRVVNGLYGPTVEASLSGLGYSVAKTTIPQGEEQKNIQTVGTLWDTFLDAGLERRSTVAALGGGVITDTTGFAAATYMRGVNWIALPTTLLGMVDASLGGKTGIDLPQGKNLAGSFHPPKFVLADPETLGSLPEAERMAGMAEVVKHGVIGDPVLFEICESGWDKIGADLSSLVSRAVAVKVKVILIDPYESGIRAALNFGHTVGHAVEAASNYRLRHGEAVAIGMVVETRLAEQMGLAQAGLTGRIASALRNLGLPTEIPEEVELSSVLRLMNSDKKTVKGSPRFALPSQIGDMQVGVVLREPGELETLLSS